MAKDKRKRRQQAQLRAALHKVEGEARARVSRALVTLITPLGLDAVGPKERALALQAVGAAWTVATLSYRRTGGFDEAAEILAQSVVASGGGIWQSMMGPVFEHLEEHVRKAPWPVQEVSEVRGNLVVRIDFLDAEVLQEADGLFDMIQGGGDVGAVVDAVVSSLAIEVD